jgi:predicted amidohydrolase YtcJ
MKHLSTYFAIAGFALLTTLAPLAAGAQAPADLVLINGHVYTVDNARPIVTAFAVRGGRIVFIGSDAEARALAARSTRVIDLHGATVLPGFTDAHAHLLGLGDELRRVNLAGSTSYQQVIDRVKTWAKDVKPGE